MKKKPKSAGAKAEMRRPDGISAKVNGKLASPLKKTEKIAKALRITGMIITVAFSIYGLIPKTDSLPNIDNEVYEIISD